MVITIQTDIDEAARQETEAILSDLGVTLPEAVAMLMRHIAAEKSLPFPTDTDADADFDCPLCPITPGPRTLAAIAEAERGGLPSFDTIADLMAWLDEDD